MNLPVEGVEEVLDVDHRVLHNFVNFLEEIPVEYQFEFLHEKVETSTDPKLEVPFNTMEECLVITFS